ncbi:hypothetical protein [Rothia nasimurium]|uniref:hypothetical protein n=1 Tax=Rothia nasimurium TaxID=85336 RepID=UPI001F481F25|nr:hypothetical protein [Rothia nasimurium]
MTKTISPKLNDGGVETARTALASELTALVGESNRSYIQGITAAAGHKVTTAKLRKILAGETDPTLMDVLAIAGALDANPIPLVIRTITAVSKDI